MEFYLPLVRYTAERISAKLPNEVDVEDLVSAGTFGFGWNESGPQHMGTNSPDKAYVGTVREFADQIAKDATALAAVKAQPHSATVTCQAASHSTS